MRQYYRVLLSFQLFDFFSDCHMYTPLFFCCCEHPQSVSVHTMMQIIALDFTGNKTHEFTNILQKQSHLSSIHTEKDRHLRSLTLNIFISLLSCTYIPSSSLASVYKGQQVRRTIRLHTQLLSSLRHLPVPHPGSSEYTA